MINSIKKDIENVISLYARVKYGDSFDKNWSKNQYIILNELNITVQMENLIIQPELILHDDEIILISAICTSPIVFKFNE